MSSGKFHRSTQPTLETPGYRGGKEALNEFIRTNLRYPKEAVNNKIQGTVIVKFDVDQNGKVHNPEVEKGLGHGCDEEALRLVRLLQYEKTKLKGYRATFHMKINIRFKLKEVQQQVQMNYNYIATSTPSNPSNPNRPGSYGYTINLPKK